MKKSTLNRMPETTVSEDGCMVVCTLRVDRKAYEFARAWAQFHAAREPHGTPEYYLEFFLAKSIWEHMCHLDWRAGPDIMALFDEEPEGSPPSETLN